MSEPSVIRFKLIEYMEAHDWIGKLIAAAREGNPDNVKLLAFSQQFGLASISERRPELERIIRAANGFLDVDQWREKLGQIETQVCRIEVRSNKGMIYGTGFLLGPDVVMTNYHVMEAVIEGDQSRATADGLRATPQDVILRFDYKKLEDGTTLNPGVEFRLPRQGWLVDKSPMSPADGSSQLGEPKPDELDYALLRVEGAPGNQPVGGEKGPRLRKWIAAPTQPHDFLANPGLFIMQHPQGNPLKLALDTEAVISLNSNYTRVRYRTNTKPGSSGSPCFNINWGLVALHHSGDPNFKPVYNGGIPFSAILNLLEKRNLKGELGEKKM